MAASSLSNLISFFIPSKPPSLSLPKLTNLNLHLPSETISSSASASSSSSKDRHGALLPIVASNDRNHHQSSNDLTSVVCPSLAYANTLFFRSAYNVQVIVEDNEPEEKLLNRFRREVMRAGIIQECKRRRFFENKQDEVKRRTRDAAKRNRRRRTMFRGPAAQERQEGSNGGTPKAQKDVGDDDNWEVPENLP